MFLMSKLHMSLQQLLFHRFRTIGWIGRFLLATCVAAAFNFADIFFQTMKAASAAGTNVVDGYEITVCYFGPPASFYPRFVISCSLLIATLGIFRRSFPRSPILVIGLIGALTAFIYWWIASYRVFRNFTEAGVSFLNNPEIKQAAYLYQGTWFDISVAVSVVLFVILLLERLIDQKRCVT